jgi:hypothetical protein
MSVPSITGKTLGTAGNDGFVVNFWTSAGSEFNARTNSLGLQTIGVDLWGVHIKVGTHTTAATALYKQPELGPELARCQRYYEVLPLQANLSTNLISSLYTGTIHWAKWDYRVTKRVPATLAGGNGFSAGWSSESAAYFNNNSSAWTSTAVLTADSEL